MKILLIKTKFKSPTFFPPLGIGYIGAVLENAGHIVKILDLSIENLLDDEFKSELLKFNPDIIGLTCMITEYAEVVRIASVCKELNSNIPIIVGGPLASSIPEQFLKQSCIDVVSIGEGEFTFLELVEKIETKGILDPSQLKDTKGIAFRDVDNKYVFNPAREIITDIDNIPYPARHLMRMEKYITPFENWFGDRSLKATNMISSRGCPYSCIFCDKTVFGNKWRGQSAVRTVDEMQMLSERYGINAVFFTDDMFDLNKKRVFEICNEIKQRGLDIVWGVESRVNHADMDMYKKMHQSGCKFIAFGIESGNQDVLNFIQKKITIEQVINAVDMAKSVGLGVMGFFMIGMFGENKDTIEQTVEFAKKLPFDSGGFSKVVPLPNTKLYDFVKKEGIVEDSIFLESSNFGAGITLVKDLSPEQLDELVDKSYWEFFWSRPARKLPKPINKFIGNQFNIIYYLTKNNLDIFLKINRLREILHIPLP